MIILETSVTRHDALWLSILCRGFQPNVITDRERHNAPRTRQHLLGIDSSRRIALDPFHLSMPARRQPVSEMAGRLRRCCGGHTAGIEAQLRGALLEGWFHDFRETGQATRNWCNTWRVTSRSERNSVLMSTSASRYTGDRSSRSR